MTKDPGDQPPLPDGLSALAGVRSLEVPSYLLKKVAVDELPPAVDELDVTGERSVTVLRALALPSLRVLRAGAGPLRFDPSQFPALEDLTIRLDRKSPKAPEIVRGCVELRALGVVGTYDPAELPTFAAALSLESLGVAGGNVSDLSFVPEFVGLKSLSVANLAKLKSIAPLAEARSLETVRLAYCQHIEDLDVLLTLPSLRELEVLRCGDLGPIKEELEGRELDRLSLI
jgi:hypothetical protein